MKVTIIDDEEISLYIAKWKMLAFGFAKEADIETYLDPAEALQVLSTAGPEELPDVILLDLSMPHIDGWQFLEQLSQKTSSIWEKCSIYVLTTSIAALDENMAKNHPLLAGYMVKPFDQEHVEILKAALNNKKRDEA